MPRTPTSFPDAQLQAILLALQQLDVRYPYPDNRNFLRHALDQIERIAGRSYGEKVFRRLMATAGITNRHPSAQTFLAVQAERRAAKEETQAITPEVRDDWLRGYVHKEIQVAVREIVPPALPAPAPVAAAPSGVDANAAWLSQHCERLEDENHALRAQLQQALERASAAEAEANSLRKQLAESKAEASARESELTGSVGGLPSALSALADRLEGAERRRMVETDSIRQAFIQERNVFKIRIESLERDLATAKTAVDAYRRGAGGIPTTPKR